MFNNLTKFILNEMDPGEELVPVESIAHNEHFRPLSLLIKKRKSKRISNPAPYYQHTRFTLDDVLLPGEDGKSIEFIHQDSSQFTLTKISGDQVDGGVRVPFDPANVGVHGAASLSSEFSIKLHKKSVSLQLLEELRRERKINMDHSFIQQLRRPDIDLYVVTEILEASEQAVYKESTKADGGLWAKLWATFIAKGSRWNTQTIVIPKGCTLAFRIIPLHIRNGAWALSGKQIVQIVEKEVKYSCRLFPELSSDLLLIVLNTIKAVMRDKNLLQELRQKMEEVPEQNDGYELKTESPDLQALFSSLQDFPRPRLLLLAEGITYVLDALHELMEDQLVLLLLLLQSLERKIVSQQLKLVKNLLECDLEYEMCCYYMGARQLSFPHEEEQRLTIALVEQSGVQLQEDGSALPSDEPFEAVAALFVVLYTLNLLSGSK